MKTGKCPRCSVRVVRPVHRMNTWAAARWGHACVHVCVHARVCACAYVSVCTGTPTGPGVFCTEFGFLAQIPCRCTWHMGMLVPCTDCALGEACVCERERDGGGGGRQGMVWGNMALWKADAGSRDCVGNCGLQLPPPPRAAPPTCCSPMCPPHVLRRHLADLPDCTRSAAHPDGIAWRALLCLMRT
uniref:Uncharacterized protein n=1 Tax=Myotis myotis TaxID=51298 RepID=A0A7J7ZWT7_MYOMY|nr:hypothetical protein mMyoMyo1_009566 [Myotis myotis]